MRNRKRQTSQNAVHGGSSCIGSDTETENCSWLTACPSRLLFCFISVFTNQSVQSSRPLGQLGILVKGWILLQELWIWPTALWQDEILFQPKVILRETLILHFKLQPFQIQTSLPREVLPWTSSWRGPKNLQYTPLSRYILEYSLYMLKLNS